MFGIWKKENNPIREEMRKAMLHSIIARAREYNAYYYKDSPLNRFIEELEAELADLNKGDE